MHRHSFTKNRTTGNTTFIKTLSELGRFIALFAIDTIIKQPSIIQKRLEEYILHILLVFNFCFPHFSNTYKLIVPNIIIAIAPKVHTIELSLSPFSKRYKVNSVFDMPSTGGNIAIRHIKYNLKVRSEIKKSHAFRTPLAFASWIASSSFIML